MHPDEGQDLPGHGPRVLHDEVAPVGVVVDVAHHQGAAAGGGAEGEEGVEDVPDDPVLLGDQIGRVVLDVPGLPDELREEGRERLPLEIPQRRLHVGRRTHDGHRGERERERWRRRR